VFIDTAFDFRTDAMGGDPDRTSPTLRRYHQLLWSKGLPNGRRFDLDTTTQWTYLHHKSDLGEFYLSSDSVIVTFNGWVSTADLIARIPEREVDWFEYIGYTIGGMMVFPSNRVGRKHTINMARGMNRTTIADRMDLTLECIRRFYAGDTDTPLGATLVLYQEFFALFTDFPGFVDFFLLQDLATHDYSGVRFFMDFDNFKSSAVPKDLDMYAKFREASIEFVLQRNKRITAWASQNLSAH
jgi:hypothetical protein